MSLCHVAIATLQLNRERAALSQIKTSRLLDQSLMETGEGACLQLLGLSCIIVVCALDWAKKETGNCLKYIDFICVDRYTHTFILYLFICMYIYIHKGGCGKVLTEGQVCQERGITWVKKTWNKCSRSTWSTCHGCQGSLKNPLKADHKSVFRTVFRTVFWDECSRKFTSNRPRATQCQCWPCRSLYICLCKLRCGSETWTDWSAGWAQSWALRMCCKTPMEKQGGIGLNAD